MCNEENIEFVILHRHMNYTFSRTKIKEIIKRQFCLSLTYAYDIAHDENVMSSLIIIGSGRKQLSMFYCITKAVLKNFAIFPEKYMCWSLFLIKNFKATLLKRDSNTGVFL